MTLLKKISLVGVMATLCFSAVAMAGIGENITWSDKTCFTISPIKSCKPSRDWDTQKTKDLNAKHKFVLHRAGANPVAWLRFDQNPKGKTAHAYAKWLKDRWSQKGLTDIQIRKEVIAGRNVAFVSGYDPHKDFRYLLGVFRNREVGIHWECSAAAKDFSVYEPQFRTFIEQTRVISETAY
jgi:hypothetical protein